MTTAHRAFATRHQKTSTHLSPRSCCDFPLFTVYERYGREYLNYRKNWVGFIFIALPNVENIGGKHPRSPVACSSKQRTLDWCVSEAWELTPLHNHIGT